MLIASALCVVCTLVICLAYTQQGENHTAQTFVPHPPPLEAVAPQLPPQPVNAYQHAAVPRAVRAAAVGSHRPRAAINVDAVKQERPVERRVSKPSLRPTTPAPTAAPTLHPTVLRTPAPTPAPTPRPTIGALLIAAVCTDDGCAGDSQTGNATGTAPGGDRGSHAGSPQNLESTRSFGRCKDCTSCPSAASAANCAGAFCCSALAAAALLTLDPRQLACRAAALRLTHCHHLRNSGAAPRHMQAPLRHTKTQQTTSRSRIERLSHSW